MRKLRAFTIIEVLVVVVIVMFLAATMITHLRNKIAVAEEVGTRTLLENVKTAIASYRADLGDYPPDGYDLEPAWGAACTPNGIKLGPPGNERLYMGSGCLIYFLCHPVTDMRLDPTTGKPSGRVFGPYLTCLQPKNLSVAKWDPTFDLAVDPSSPGFKPGWEVCEILDEYGWPIHYDKVGPTGSTIYFDPTRFVGARGCLAHSDQTYWATCANLRVADKENVCTLSTPAHERFPGPMTHVDPRATPESDHCLLDISVNPVPRNSGAYDLWSHGQSLSNGLLTVWPQ